MDYIITDKITSPADLASQYSEKLAFMKDTFFIGDHMHMFPHMENKLTVKVTDANGQATKSVIYLNAVDLEPIKALATAIDVSLFSLACIFTLFMRITQVSLSFKVKLGKALFLLF